MNVVHLLVRHRQATGAVDDKRNIIMVKLCLNQTGEFRPAARGAVAISIHFPVNQTRAVA